MLSEQLKVNTRNNHQLLEKKLTGKIRSVSETEDYIELLALFYSYFGGLEVLINKHIDATQLPDYAERRKSAALADDLYHFNATLTPLAINNELPVINNHLHALGALYVIEGSTLGGKIISKLIGRQLNINGNLGISFFNGYGDDTEVMWAAFKQAIDQPLLPVDEQIVIDAANETFIKFGQWFDKHTV